MANRHLARSVVLQTLFERDVRGALADDHEEILRRNLTEFADGADKSPFARDLLRGIVKRQGDLDIIITKAAPDWPLEKIAPIDRNVLRIGLYELLFVDRTEVPAKVAINEAIELAKAFGGETSGRFVNGVLGSVYKELGEPGKDDASPRRKRDVPYEKMLVQKLGGAVVYAREGSEVYVALVHDIFGHWTLSKGKLEGEEKVEDGTIREIKEELGLDITVQEPLGVNEYVATDPEKGKIRKQVHYFLGESPFTEVKLGTSGGLDDARWFKLADIVNLNFYPDTLPIITKAVNLLLKQASAGSGRRAEGTHRKKPGTSGTPAQ